MSKKIRSLHVAKSGDHLKAGHLFSDWNNPLCVASGREMLREVYLIFRTCVCVCLSVCLLRVLFFFPLMVPVVLDSSAWLRGVVIRSYGWSWLGVGILLGLATSLYVALTYVKSARAALRFDTSAGCVTACVRARVHSVVRRRHC